MLLVMSLAALAVAAGLGTLAWRVIREDRARAAARIAALGSAIDAEASGTETVAGIGSLFAPKGRTRSNPLVIIAGGFVVVVLFIIGLALGNGGSDSTTAPVAQSAAQQNPSLELLSMRHDRRDNTLTVTGLVRNPGAVRAERIVAVVFAFDREGAFVASARAPLDFTSLAGGDESPFRVTVPDVGDVGRYRVSFRTENGVIRHVDRRRNDSPSTGEPTVTTGNTSTQRLQVVAR